VVPQGFVGGRISVIGLDVHLKIRSAKGADLLLSKITGPSVRGPSHVSI
jgi:hypothetical protein